MAIAQWKYRNNTAIADPGRGSVRFSHIDPLLATTIAISNTSDNGVVINTRVSDLVIGDVLLFTSPQVPTKTAQFQIVLIPIDHGAWSQITVSAVATSGAGLTNGETLQIAIEGDPPIAAPVHVTLPDAKAHLRITTASGDPRDADIQTKLDQADAIILNYLKGANGAAIDWIDPQSTPAPVQAAILLMLGRLYEQRGDNEKNDADLWTAIDRMLIRFRDPAIA